MVLFIGTNISSGDFSFVGSLLVDDWKGHRIVDDGQTEKLNINFW
jgi:hypothetical protein